MMTMLSERYEDVYQEMKREEMYVGGNKAIAWSSVVGESKEQQQSTHHESSEHHGEEKSTHSSFSFAFNF